MADTSAATPGSRPAARYRLTVNTYDRTATLLIALLVMVGLAVLGMAFVFFAGRLIYVVAPIPVVPVEATSPNANQGVAEEPEPPGFEEAPDLTEPQLQDTLDALTNAVSTKQALLSEESIDVDSEAGHGDSLGDSRMAGPGGDGVVERVPRWERWKIRFEPASDADFAEWLDYYNIEIGVLGRDNKVYFAADFSTGQPNTRIDEKPSRETRGYTLAADGPMPRLTNELARKAGIAQHGPLVLLFYPFDKVEAVLWTLEREYAGDRDVNSIRETTFEVRKDANNYTFVVVDQKYF